MKPIRIHLGIGRFDSFGIERIDFAHAQSIFMFSDGAELSGVGRSGPFSTYR